LNLLEGHAHSEIFGVSKSARMSQGDLNANAAVKWRVLIRRFALRMQFMRKQKEKAAEKAKTIKSKTGRKKRLVRTQNQSETKGVQELTLHYLKLVTNSNRSLKRELGVSVKVT